MVRRGATWAVAFALLLGVAAPARADFWTDLEDSLSLFKREFKGSPYTGPAPSPQVKKKTSGSPGGNGVAVKEAAAGKKGGNGGKGGKGGASAKR